jgi:serine/threonine protein kinase
VVRLLDYGVTPFAAWIVMERCECSLGKWRAESHSSLPGGPVARLAGVLHLFQAVVARVAQLHAAGVAHYDLKADNVLLRRGGRAAMAVHTRRLDTALRRAAAAPPGTPPALPHWRELLPFVCLADFGESDFRPDLPAQLRPLLLGRGTECVKAPELLRAARAHGVPPRGRASTVPDAEPLADADPRDRPAASTGPALSLSAASACDVWSSGCLLYELLAGAYLYSPDDDWARFFLAVTGDATSATLAAAAAVVPGASAGDGASPRAAATAEAEGAATPAATTGLASLPLLPPERVEALAGRHGVPRDAVPVLAGLLRSILVRDAAQRPPAGAVLGLVDGALGAITRA